MSEAGEANAVERRRGIRRLCPSARMDRVDCVRNHLVIAFPM
ncbi:hypothetical protein BURMUCF2_1115 [Burkholderia multivorans CF2]|nr:hypothetical protein BURMUCF2_1115 [Burkholderia multivorans CF2]